MKDTITYNGIPYKVTKIADNAFRGNKKIKTVYTGKNVTEIGAVAFYKNSNLTTIKIGPNVVKIGAHAFCFDKKVKKVQFLGNALTSLEKPHTFTKIKGCKVILPKKKAADYKKLLNKSGMKKYKIVKK